MFAFKRVPWSSWMEPVPNGRFAFLALVRSRPDGGLAFQATHLANSQMKLTDRSREG